MKKQVSFSALICIFSIFSANSLLAKGNSLKAPSTDLKNFHEFSRNVFRGAQPTKEGFNKLKKLGIKTIIDLVPNHTDEKLIEGLGFSYYQIPVKPWRLEDAGVIQFLTVVTDTKNYPIFIHGDNGEEKTGLMVAVYRVYAQDWTTYDATKECCKAGMKKYWDKVSGCLDGVNRSAVKEAIKQ